MKVTTPITNKINNKKAITSRIIYFFTKLFYW